MRSRRILGFLSAALLAGGCGDGGTDVRRLPDTLAYVSGDAQQGALGDTLPSALVVRVMSSAGEGVQGIHVNFEASQGVLLTPQVMTDESGEAQTKWVLRGRFGNAHATATSPALPDAELSFVVEVQPRLIDIGTLGHNTRASDINNKGEVIGNGASVEQGPPLAFRWSVDKPMTPLNPLIGSDPFASASAINSNGVVVGSSGSQPGSEQEAVIWRALLPEPLPSLGGSFTSALAINDEGIIVGQAEDQTRTPRAVVWRDGRIDWLTSEVCPDGNAAATAISPEGIVGGHVMVEADDGTCGTSRAALWRENGLELLPGGTVRAINSTGEVITNTHYWSPAMGAVAPPAVDLENSWFLSDLNERGEIVGLSGNMRPFYWMPGNSPIFLPGLVGPEGFAFSINDHGQVVGTSRASDGIRHAVMWVLELP